jgi:CO/xanthine dehydrogenase Mo-binding subunit
VTFASESFIDELAAAAKTDPYEFRMRMLRASTTEDSGFKRARSIAVLKAAADKYGWTPRPYPQRVGRGTPASVEVVLVNGDPNQTRPDLPHYGAGETACKPLLAAVANAIYDATGVRLRRVPFRDARVLAALKSAGVNA